jgi:DNA mismatch endonuclease (patch repair protein)
MADTFTHENRSRLMSRVKGRDTKPEKLVRSLLHAMGYRFRLHRKDLPGKPDIVLPKHKKVIFVHGCFWHGHLDCSRAARPASNREFWDRKIDGNIARDRKAKEELSAMGWEMLIVWTCQMKKRNLEELIEKLRRFVEGEPA